MAISWNLLARIALPIILVLALAVGGTPERSCSHMSGIISDSLCATGDVSPGAGLATDEVKEVSPALAATSVETERNTVAVVAAARVAPVGDGFRPTDRAPTRSTIATSLPHYIRYCVFLC